jgi:hypothetical protein
VIGPAGEGSIRRIYILTMVLAAAGFVAFWPMQGFKVAVGFLLGAIASLGNLFLFGYLARAISPEGGDKKPWQARAFVSRYILLLGGGYAIVKALDVSPFAVIVGLLASTGAAVLSIIIELAERVFAKSTTR